jgi:uncharacterized alkaline shock family protein YloU
VFDVETKIGNIHFSKDILNRIIHEAVASCNGKVEINNYKGEYMNMVPGLASKMKMNMHSEDAGGIDIKEVEDGIEVCVYIVVKFGTSIQNVTNKIIDFIYEHMEKTTGQKPLKVTVIVTGTSSKNIAKRHIEVSR